jgi:ABC-2 type transport system permease protein
VAERTVRATGSIYDLGYRSYTGERLGRPYAVFSLFVFSLRAVFGLGRSAWAKVFAFGLAFVALLPAFIQLAVAALAPVEFEYAEPATYFGLFTIVLVLFCGATAPEIVGRDQRNKTLALYFSRSLFRVDYVAAKLAALTAALLAVQLLPQAMLVIGNAVATEDVMQGLADDADLVPPILASSFLAALAMAALSLAIASQTPRRAWSTGALVVFFVISTTLGETLAESLTGDARQYSMLISPIGVLEGAAYWMFDVAPDEESGLAKAGLEGGYYLLASLGYILLAGAVLFRRFLRLSV